MGMLNGRVGYVYLVDPDLKIRWGGCADARDEESRALETCTGVLLTRLDKNFEVTVCTCYRRPSTTMASPTHQAAPRLG
jgi:hypothetical protein